MLIPKETLAYLKKKVLQIFDDLENGNSYISEKGTDMLSKFVNEVTRCDQPISKYEAAKFLNVSRATFDNKIRIGEFPEGKKIAGFKEKVWYKRDLQKLLTKSGSSEC